MAGVQGLLKGPGIYWAFNVQICIKKYKNKLNRAPKCSILGPQNLGWGGPGPPALLDPHLNSNAVTISLLHLLILSMQVALLGAMDARENLELNIQSDSS